MYQLIRLNMFLWIVLSIGFSWAQDSVDVTFRYSNGPQSYLVGEFNGWDNSAAPMNYEGIWVRTERLLMNPDNTIQDAYQYKFYYSGVTVWPNDPLNHHVNVTDNNNSILYVRNPTIYHFLPNNRSGFVEVGNPIISVYLYPKVGSVVDTASIVLKIDDTVYSHIGSYYNFSKKQLSFLLPDALEDGSHKATLTVGENSDSVSFVVQAQPVVTVPLPSYANHGVTLPTASSNDSVTFRLKLSGVNSVILNISEEGQDLSNGSAYVMRKDPGSDNWWLNLKFNEGGYEYQYQTDEGAVFNDPWGKWNGTYGSLFYVGSAGLTADDYEWASNGYQTPDPERLVIYELHVGEFGGGYFGLPAAESGFLELAELMPHFDSLGINAIELMPVMD